MVDEALRGAGELAFEERLVKACGGGLELDVRLNSSVLSEPLPSNLVAKMGILVALPFCASGFSACACAPLFAIFAEVVGLG